MQSTKGTGKTMKPFLAFIGGLLTISLIVAFIRSSPKAAELNQKNDLDKNDLDITVIESLSIYVGNTDKIKLDSSDKTVKFKSFKSLDNMIATVTEGVVIAQAVGTTKVITTIVVNGKDLSYTTDITVKPGKVIISPEEATIHVGEITKLKTMVSCGVFNSLSFKSNNNKVASVEKDGIYGVVTGHSSGSATITATVNVGGKIIKNKIEIQVEPKDKLILPISNPINGMKYTVKSNWEGSRVYFGEYEQDDNLKNGKEPILWRVLEVTDDSILLLSEYGLLCKNYNDTFTQVTWETSSMRSWLNSTFLDTAFTNLERDAINDTLVANSDNEKYGTRGGKNTIDKVYLLSYDEAQNNAYGFQSGISNKSKSRTMKLTKHALDEGYVNKDNGNTCWWLRTPGITNQYAAYVFTVGSITDSYFVGRRNDAVRPVIKVKLSSIIFGNPIIDGTTSYPTIVPK